MENKFNQEGVQDDFTNKGRTSNPGGSSQEHQGDPKDISNIDRQEGELNHGTTARDQHLFSSDEPKENERS